ncbi:hypothetical protein SAMN05444166_5850 [Singulisphaera sp. GP187]|nr:hypothetical protein SAMN05444166_5850 [Singulisphaera sp. GP187]
MDPAWDEFRRRQRAFWLAILLCPPWFAFGSLLCDFIARFGLNYDILFILIAALPALGNIMVAHWRKLFWPCPNCGRPFHLTWFYGNLMARECVHCDLRKWAPVKAKTIKSISLDQWNPVADEYFDK